MIVSSGCPPHTPSPRVRRGDGVTAGLDAIAAAACWWGKIPTTDAIAAIYGLRELAIVLRRLGHSRGAGLDGRP